MLNKILLILIILQMGCYLDGKSSREESTSAEVLETNKSVKDTYNPPILKDPPHVDHKKIIQEYLETPTLEEVLPKTGFSDSESNFDEGTVLFAIWGSNHLKWKDVDVKSETSFERFTKNPDAERGKRSCWSVFIAEIYLLKVEGEFLSFYKKDMYQGEFMDNKYKVYSFIAINDTGELVALSKGRFCGFVAGFRDYDNKLGDSIHSVQLVGMFDLPSNRNIK